MVPSFENLSNERPFQWPRGYYDRVVRNEHELENIYEYIEQNPYNWEEDVLNDQQYDPKKVKKFLGSFS